MAAFEGWLVGFIEGEGSFSSNRGRYPVFALAQTDESILKRMQTFFGGGSVSYQPTHHAWQYSAYGKACWPIRRFCEGKLVMKKKIDQFERWKLLRWPAEIGEQTTFQQSNPVNNGVIDAPKS